MGFSEAQPALETDAFNVSTEGREVPLRNAILSVLLTGHLVMWEADQPRQGAAHRIPEDLPLPQVDRALLPPTITGENYLGSEHRSTRQMGPFRRNQSRHKEDALPVDAGWATSRRLPTTQAEWRSHSPSRCLSSSRRAWSNESVRGYETERLLQAGPYKHPQTRLQKMECGVLSCLRASLRVNLRCICVLCQLSFTFWV